MDKALENLVGGFRYRRTCSNISPRWKLHRQPGKGGKAVSIIAATEGLNSSAVKSPRTTRVKQPSKKLSKPLSSDHAMNVREDALQFESCEGALQTIFSRNSVMSNIFSNLTDQDLLACRLVSYTWCQLASFELEARGRILGAILNEN